jgi:heme o synthase
VQANEDKEAKSRSNKLRDYAVLTKLRLASLVIVSAGFGYFIGTDSADMKVLLSLLVGGTLVTMGANGMNQVWERVSDALMERTRNRPIPSGRMGWLEAWLVSVAFAAGGVIILFLGTNNLTAFFSLGALLSYVFVYTPMKRVSPMAVFVGAFPGAAPPMLGWIAATGEITHEGWILFALQFVWQFPHFWSIAWRLDSDYRKGGFYLLPFSDGHSQRNAFQILLYTLALLPLSWLPFWFGYLNLGSTLIIFLASVGFAIPALQLYFSLNMKDATKLMFASFVYLPVILTAYLINF